MSRTITIVTSLLLAMSPALFGQITVNNGFMPAPGTVVNYPSDISPDQGLFDQMSAGSGGSMVWDFSTRSYATAITQVSYPLATTPEIDSFPAANLVMLMVSSNDSIWSPYTSNSGEYTRLGSVSHYLGLEYILKYFNQTPDWVFPVNYNDQWTSYRHLDQRTEFSYTLTFDTTYNVVDAWGTAKYKSNSFPCLRVRSVDRIYIKSYDISDVLLDSALTTTTSVSFVGTEFAGFVTVAKVESGTSVTYISTANADFVNMPTDVHQTETASLPTGYKLSQNYPNPFNPTTEIDFTVPATANVELDVYDVLGRKVKTLVDQTMAAGSYIADWDGTNQSGARVASGVYFYRMLAGLFSQTRRMVLLK